MRVQTTRESPGVYNCCTLLAALPCRVGKQGISESRQERVKTSLKALRPLEALRLLDAVTCLHVHTHTYAEGEREEPQQQDTAAYTFTRQSEGTVRTARLTSRGTGGPERSSPACCTVRLLALITRASSSTIFTRTSLVCRSVK